MSPARPDIDPDALAPGTRLGELEVERVLGIGGFGIVYLAFDHALERRVAVKEYMPASLAWRRDGMRIAVRSEAHAETFGIGLRSFVNEARLLARFDHPALVKVHRFWEQHGTAYMAMPYYEGRTLGSTRAAMGSPPDEAWLLALADAMLGALDALHRENVYHRDVAPDNILLQADGGAVLLDFGAARHVIGDHTQSLTAILKPNFAPIEQYADSALLRQGPWSDLYSLGAVLYFCLIGRAPLPAAMRVLHDELPSLRALRGELVAADGSHYSEALLATVDAALAVRPEARPQAADEMRARLRGQTLASFEGPRALPAPSASGVAAAAERASFAATEVQRRGPQTAHTGRTDAVITSWTTLAPDPGVAADGVPRVPPEVAPRATRRARQVALLASPLVLAALLGYALWQPGAPADALADPAPTGVRALAAPAPAVAPDLRPPGRGEAAPAAPRDRATAAVATPAPAPAPARSAAAAPREVPARPRATAAPVLQSTPPVQSARASCGDRNPVSLLFCINRQCNKPAFAADPECVAARERIQNEPKPLF